MIKRMLILIIACLTFLFIPSCNNKYQPDPNWETVVANGVVLFQIDEHYPYDVAYNARVKRSFEKVGIFRRKSDGKLFAAGHINAAEQQGKAIFDNPFYNILVVKDENYVPFYKYCVTYSDGTTYYLNF